MKANRRMKQIHCWLRALLTQVRQLPQTCRQARARRLRQKVLDQGEAERLDRIRHPWKYLGK